MKIRTWNESFTDKESKDLAYWERNMLALKFAEGWYNDDVYVHPQMGDSQVVDYSSGRSTRPRFDGWRRVLSLDGGQMTFHIPDNFPVGNLPEIERNWDGHSTEEKWQRVLDQREVKGDE